MLDTKSDSRKHSLELYRKEHEYAATYVIHTVVQ